jgi:hypothetical protein
VKQSQSLYIKYTQLAANQGDAMALCNLGVAYLYGEGVVSDEKMALLVPLHSLWVGASLTSLVLSHVC